MDINIDNISKENKKELKIQEEFGKNIVEYCSQFKGDKYTIGMKSIEFGYQLAQEELETESIQEEKTSWSRKEVIKLCMDAMLYSYMDLPENLTPIQGMNKWIEENL